MGEKWVVPLMPLEGVWAALDKVQLGGTLSCAVVRWPGARVANLFKNSLSFITLSLPPFCLSSCNQTILSSHFSPYHTVPLYFQFQPSRCSFYVFSNNEFLLAKLYTSLTHLEPWTDYEVCNVQSWSFCFETQMQSEVASALRVMG